MCSGGGDTEDLVEQRREITLLVRQVRGLTELVKGLRDDKDTHVAVKHELGQLHDSQDRVRKSLYRELGELEKRVDKIHAAVFESEGQNESLVSRVNTLERYQAGELTGPTPALQLAPKGKWQFWGMVGPGIVALLAAIAALLKSYAGGGG